MKIGDVLAFNIKYILTHIYQPPSKGDNVLGSVRLSVGVQRSILGARLCRVQQRAKKSDYQTTVFVCVLNNCMDAVDQLLIKNHISHRWMLMTKAFGLTLFSQQEFI